MPPKLHTAFKQSDLQRSTFYTQFIGNALEGTLSVSLGACLHGVRAEGGATGCKQVCCKPINFIVISKQCLRHFTP